MTEKEALKLALEALKYPLNQSHENFNVDMAELLAHRAITAIKEALAEQPAQQDSTCSNALRIQHKAYPRTCKKCGLGPCVELAQQALDKKAENARELGLNYEPVPENFMDALKFDVARREWVGLTDEEIWETVSRIGTSDSDVNPYAKLADARAIEAKLKEKNT